MATIDTSIYSRASNPLRSMADYEADLYGLDQKRQQVRAGQMALDEKQRVIADANQLRDVTRGFGGDSTANYNALLRTGSLSAAQTYQKQVTDVAKDRAETGRAHATAAKTENETVDLVANRYRTDLAMVKTPADMAKWLVSQYADPTLGPVMAQRRPMMDAIKAIPDDPAEFEALKLKSALGMKEFIEAEQKKATLAQTIASATQMATDREAARKETERANREREANVRRGQNLTDARAREGNNLQREAARTQVIQSEDGFHLVDKGTGKVTPLTGADGKPLGPKLKDAPAAVQKAMIENGTNLRRAERALELITGNTVGEAVGDKEATGFKGYLPGAILNRVDAKGVDARAAIADLGSLVIHERSGAAVTAAEFPRLAPFIPLSTDDAKTVEKKVKRFVQVYKEEMAATQEAYGPSSGYRQPGGGAKTPEKPGAAGAYTDAEKERRYQEWKAKQK